MRFLPLFLAMLGCGEQYTQSCGDSPCDPDESYCRGEGELPDDTDLSNPGCVAYPAACENDRTCACLEAEGEAPTGTCTEDDEGISVIIP